MWSQIALCLLVGLVAATPSGTPAWKSNTEYVYEIRGRTLASLHEVADEYSGILVKAKLHVQSRSNERLAAQIKDAQYAQVHSHLPEGWNTRIPDDKLQYKRLPILNKPFEIEMKEGIVRNLIVDKEVQEWEANFIRSIVSQIQLDTTAQNKIESSLNILPRQDSMNGVYKTLEDTVTGITETLYEIKPLPEYVLQSKPWLAPFPHLKGDGHIYEVYKSKNFTDSEERPGYYFGLAGMDKWEPATNKMGDIVTRTSVGHAIISGNYNRYTIQHSMTVNKIIVNPTLNNQQKGSVVSFLNLTLSDARQMKSQLEKLNNPVELGSLVYHYSQQHKQQNKVRPGQQYRREEYSAESDESYERRFNSPSQGRFRRSLEQELRDSRPFESVSNEEKWQQETPKINEAPKSPLLPFTIGYKGQPIKHADQVKIQQAVQKLANEIARDLEQYQEVPKKNTLAKFVLMSSLVRIMDEQEMKNTARDLYTQDKEGTKRAAWVAFRDAVAEAGTGPALLVVKEWIESEKIKHEEAAEIIETLTNAVRQPTEEYIRTYFKLITKPEVQRQTYLNETALLAFSELVRRVYVNRFTSHMEYPVHSFGEFRTEEGKKFVTKEYIPFLAQQLEKAINEADARRIHVYIRALGNVGHENILEVFEPYLEGKKQVSQFQRLLMVMALDKLVENEPKTARNVLYRIYQNIGERQEVRTAAVYQLMKTVPPTDMLQRMAEYTHQDPSKYVRSAVKSAIETAAQLKGKEEAMRHLRSSAEAAKPLLTKEEFGVQYNKDPVYHFVDEQMKIHYKQNLQTIFGEDSVVPKTLRYSLRAQLGGLRRHLINAQVMVSSLDDLMNTLEKQTESYKQQEQRQEQESAAHKWSSEKIAKLLKLNVEQREQLEGQLYLRMGNLHKIFNFDNQTVELIPEVMREVEETLKNGKTFRYQKWSNLGELTIAFPTEMGMPFIYTYDVPTLIKIDGKVVAKAQPQISSNGKLNQPEKIEAETEVRALVSAKVQAKIGFVTPFDHQEYATGYDKNIQFHVPIRARVNVDLKQKEVKTEVEALEPQKNTRLVHYSTWPYTTIYDLLTLEPIANRKETKIIYKERQHQMDQVFGEKSTGVAIRVQFHTEERFMDLAELAKKVERHGLFTTLMTPFLEEKVQHSEFDIEYMGERSTTRKIKAVLSGDWKFQKENNEQEESLEQLSKLPTQPREQRTQQLLRKVSAGIKDSKSFAVDAEVEFEGQQKIKYVASAALAKSNVDPASRVLFVTKKISQKAESKPYLFALKARTIIPNTNGINPVEAIKMQPEIESKIQFLWGEHEQSASKAHVDAKWKKTEERKQHLLESSLYHQCRREMEQKHYLLPACAQIQQHANILDHVKVNMKFENVHEKTRQYVHQLTNAIRFWTYLNMEEELGHGNQQPNEVQLEAKFANDLRSVNVTIVSEDRKMKLKELRLNEYVQRIVAVHPVFHAPTRVAAKMYGLTTYRPICVVDKKVANTFDNKTYPLELTNMWTVMLQYVNQKAREHHEQIHHQQPAEHVVKQQLENYVVLARKEGERKEVKIIAQSPWTLNKVVDITLKPSGQKVPKVFINDQEVKVQEGEKKLHELYQGFVEIYALPTGEIKAEVRDAFYVIYDGERVKLTVTGWRFRDSIRGLCGTFDGESFTDFTSPRNCILRDPREFMASWTVMPEGQQDQQIMNLRSQSEKSHCIPRRSPLYVNYISERNQERSYGHNTCSTHRTKYTIEGGNICFSLRPLPACRPECRATEQVEKEIEMHCMTNNRVAELWRKQIEKGSNPDLSSKTVSKIVKMTVPARCQA